MKIVKIKQSRPHPTRDGYEILSLYTADSGIRQGVTVAIEGKYPVGSLARYWPSGALKDGKKVKAALIYQEWSDGELEPLNEQI